VLEIAQQFRYACRRRRRRSDPGQRQEEERQTREYFPHGYILSSDGGNDKGPLSQQGCIGNTPKFREAG